MKKPIDYNAHKTNNAIITIVLILCAICTGISLILCLVYADTDLGNNTRIALYYFGMFVFFLLITLLVGSMPLEDSDT